MSTPLVFIPWIASLIFAGVLCFRLGYWWKMTELQGRHAVGNAVRRDDPWESGDELAADAVDEEAEIPGRRSG